MDVYKIYYTNSEGQRVLITKMLGKDILKGKSSQSLCCSVVAKESLHQFEGAKRKIYIVAIDQLLVLVIQSGKEIQRHEVYVKFLTRHPKFWVFNCNKDDQGLKYILVFQPFFIRVDFRDTKQPVGILEKPISDRDELMPIDSDQIGAVQAPDNQTITLFGTNNRQISLILDKSTHRWAFITDEEQKISKRLGILDSGDEGLTVSEDESQQSGTDLNSSGSQESHTQSHVSSMSSSNMSLLPCPDIDSLVDDTSYLSEAKLTMLIAQTTIVDVIMP